MKMQWYGIDNLPTDSEPLLVINENLPNFLPHKAYYDKETNTFYSLESDASIPLKVTHWIFLPTQEDIKQ